MTDTQTLIAQAYSAFNQRNVDGALALMSENVSWPKASEGGRVVGKEEIRAYWTRQWQEFDPQVEPIEVIDRERGKTDVRVRQLVKSLMATFFRIARCGTFMSSRTVSSNAWTSRKPKRARPEPHPRHFPSTSMRRGHRPLTSSGAPVLNRRSHLRGSLGGLVTRSRLVGSDQPFYR